MPLTSRIHTHANTHATPTIGKFFKTDKEHAQIMGMCTEINTERIRSGKNCFCICSNVFAEAYRAKLTLHWKIKSNRMKFHFLQR